MSHSDAHRSAASPRVRETLEVLGLLGVLEILTFWPFFSGRFVINGDVNAHYMSDAHDWWTRGGMVDPPVWVPYAWMGRPAGSNLQDGSYVLLQGLTASTIGWHPVGAALTMALVVAIGAAGMYLLARRFTGHHGAALIAAVAQFYAPTLFANAQWPDFQRGAAYLPWLLLVASPLWPWRRRWAIPVASLILWQVAVGVYPGQLIAAVYCVGPWALAWLWSQRHAATGWWWRVLVSGGLALLLSAVKLVPALALGTGERPWEPQRVLADIPILASLFFPYDNPAMGWDIALRPFFIVTPVLFLALAAPWRGRAMIPPALMGAGSLLLIIMTTLRQELLDVVPGMSLSRVVVNDLRVYLIAAVILAGAAGWAQLSAAGHAPPRRVWSHALLLAAVAALLAGSLDWGGWGIRGLAGSVIPFLTLAVTGWAITRRGALQEAQRRRTGTIVLAACTVSGAAFAFAVTSTWAAPRHAVETSHYGSPFSEFRENSDCWAPSAQRPERQRPSTAPEEYWHDNPALRAAFTCDLALSGYVNIPGNPVLRAQADALIEDTGDLHEFVLAPGSLEPVPGDEAGGDHRARVDVTPVHYDPDGIFVYDVTSGNAVTVRANESAYPGWSADWCPEDGECRPLPTGATAEHLLTVDLPSGQGRLTLDYSPPRFGVLRALFGVGLALVALSAAVPPSRSAGTPIHRMTRGNASSLLAG